MNSEIPAIYTDKHGTINTIIKNNFETLTIELDGITFTGRTFDYFEPENATALPSRFVLGQQRQLIDYRLVFRIALSTWKGNIQIPGFLVADITREENKNGNRFHGPYYHFSFEFENETIALGQLPQFEGVFEMLREKLPSDILVKTCYTCLYSDYSIYGSDTFGTMMCFKNVKDEYLKVTGKDEYMDMMDNFDKMVQETYLCEDFAIRTGTVGYRG